MALQSGCPPTVPLASSVSSSRPLTQSWSAALRTAHLTHGTLQHARQQTATGCCTRYRMTGSQLILGRWFLPCLHVPVQQHLLACYIEQLWSLLFCPAALTTADLAGLHQCYTSGKHCGKNQVQAQPTMPPSATIPYMLVRLCPSSCHLCTTCECRLLQALSVSSQHHMC